MVRKQFAIDQSLNALLKKRAKELGVAEAEIIRRCLSERLEPRTDRGWTRDELYDQPRAWFQKP